MFCTSYINERVHNANTITLVNQIPWTTAICFLKLDTFHFKIRVHLEYPAIRTVRHCGQYTSFRRLHKIEPTDVVEFHTLVKCDYVYSCSVGPTSCFPILVNLQVINTCSWSLCNLFYSHCLSRSYSAAHSSLTRITNHNEFSNQYFSYQLCLLLYQDTLSTYTHNPI